MIKSARSFTKGLYHTVKTMEEYQKIVANIKTPYLVDFYADWCGPCKVVWPLIDKR